MYSFLLRPKWIVFHVVVLAAIIGMLFAAKWQWDRYNARDDFVTTVETRQDRDTTPAVPLTSLLGSGDDITDIADIADIADIEYRIATATGSYVQSGQLLQINRTQNGVNGVNVLTPFQIDDGPIVIVNRGFVPDGAEPPPAPAAPLVIGGTVRTSQQRRTGELTDNAVGEAIEVRRIDLPLIAERLGIDVAPVYLDFIASDPASPEPPIPVPAPDLTGGPPHLSYAVQWLVFSISVGVGWVFAVRRSLRTRRRASAQPADKPADDPADDPAGEPVSGREATPAQPSA